MKKVFQAIGFVVALTVMFCAGWYGWSFYEFCRDFGRPHIHSDHIVRERIKKVLPKLPESAHHLYYAIDGFQDADEFLACSVPEADFGPLLAEVRELAKVFGSGGDQSIHEPSKHGPDSWPDDKKDPLWNLSQYPDIVVETTNRTTIAYSVNGHRVFVFLWGGTL